MKKSTKMIISISFLVILVSVAGIFMKINHDKKVAQNLFIEYAILHELPVYGNIDDVRYWLDEQGYEYRYDELNRQVNRGETAEGWSFDVSETQNGIVMFCSWNKHNIDIVRDNCLVQLEEFYGQPTRMNDRCAWYTDGTSVLGLFFSKKSVYFQLGCYSDMNQYL